ncbi:MAG: hypothetical protein HZA51_16250 [Planctomycetes bacterium]|nr:hypothetical protein [Planctomycetota bacterium]
MDEEAKLEDRYRFFTEKGIDLAIEHDKILITLFVAIIAEAKKVSG